MWFPASLDQRLPRKTQVVDQGIVRLRRDQVGDADPNSVVVTLLNKRLRSQCLLLRLPHQQAVRGITVCEVPGLLFQAVRQLAAVDLDQAAAAHDLRLQAGVEPHDHDALLAAGVFELEVLARPRVAIIPTGSELVEVTAQPAGAQIRNSNSLQLAAQVERAGHTAEMTGIVEDDRDLLAEKISGLMERCDLLLVVGTSAQVYPAAGIPLSVKQRGGMIFEFNQEAALGVDPMTGMSTITDYFFHGDIVKTLPLLLHTMGHQK